MTRRKAGFAIQALIDGKKVCRGCGQEKALDSFHVNRRAGDGRHTRCKDCVSAYMQTLPDSRLRGRVGRPFLTDEQMQTKRCPRCGVVKALSEFSSNSSARRGVQNFCRDCLPSVRRVSQKRRWANPVSRWKAQVRILTGYAIRLGLLIPKPCEQLTSTSLRCRGEEQAHHDDYSKPLEVRWLCRTHHAAYHAKERDRA